MNRSSLRFKQVSALTVILGGLLAASLAEGRVRAFHTIMPLGDSLTAGVQMNGVLNGGYRPDLDRLLRKAGFKIRFVGSVTSGPPDFLNNAHEGHPGFKINQIAEGIEEKIDQYMPDAVLLGAGGNDEVTHDHVEEAPRRLMSLALRILNKAPNIVVFVQTRPLRLDGLEPINETFAQEVVRLAKIEGAVTHRLFLVDNHRALGPDDLCPDHIHPNTIGNAKLAASWFHALQSVL